jgi:hypothetical protein
MKVVKSALGIQKKCAWAAKALVYFNMIQVAEYQDSVS